MRILEQRLSVACQIIQFEVSYEVLHEMLIDGLAFYRYHYQTT
jgi:hypothetical protein